MPETKIGSFEKPDHTKEMPLARLDIMELGQITLTRLTLEPGWRWEDHASPSIGTTTCQLRHTQAIIAGHLFVRMDDGTEFTLGPGDVAHVEPGHLARVIGEEPVISIEFEPDMAKTW